MEDLTPNYHLPAAQTELDIPPTLAASSLSQPVGGFMAGPNSLTQGQITHNAANEQILVGAATTPLAGVGIFIGNAGDGTYHFRAGDPSGNYIHWDGSAATLTVNGDLIIGNLSRTIGPTKSIQLALNALNAAGGGTLYLTSGTWTLAGDLTLYPSVNIIGVSPTATVLNFNNAAHGLKIAGGSAYTTGTISSISGGVNVTGSGTSWSGNVTAGQTLFLGTRAYVIAAVTSNTTLVLAEGYGDNVTFPASYRITTQATNITVENIGFKNSTATALALSDSRFIQLINCQFISNHVGLSITNCSEVIANALLVASGTSDGIQCTNFGRFDWSSVNVISNSGNGFTLNNCKTGSLYACTADANTRDGFNLTTAVDLVFVADASANTGNGFQFVSGCSSCDVFSGSATGNGADGLRVTASTSNLHIYGLDISGNTGHGLNNLGGTSVIISTNTFAGNTSSSVNDAGTGTIIRGNSGVDDNSTSTITPAFGDGSDGTAVITGTTTLTRDMYYSTLTVNGTLNTAGYRVFVSDTISGTGTIQNNGNAGTAGGAGTSSSFGGGGAGGSATTGYTLNTAGAPGTTAGGSGNNGASSTNALGSSGQNGGTGGGGGTTGAGAGGTGGTASIGVKFGIFRWRTVDLLDLTSSGATVKLVPQGGAAGGGFGSYTSGSGFPGGGGGGGASGGILFIAAKNWAGSFTISSTGGTGGNGGAAYQGSGTAGGGGGGAGGNGGYAVTIYQNKTWTGSYALTAGSGGTGGLGVGAGAAGSSGSNGLAGSYAEFPISTLL